MKPALNYDEKLDMLCPSQGIEFKGDVFRSLCGPLVYVLLGDEDLPLYIGMSSNGLSRPCDPRHGALKARSICTSVLIYACKSVYQATALERFLIRKLNPQYNIQNKSS